MANNEFWYDSDVIIDIYKMLLRFDKAKLGIQNDDDLSGYDLECGALAETKHKSCMGALLRTEKVRFLLGDKRVSQFFRNADSFLRKSKEFHGLEPQLRRVLGEETDPVMDEINTEEDVNEDVRRATIPMTKYLSPSIGFNSFFRAYPGLVVAADIINFYENSGMELKFRPFGELKLKSASQIPTLEEDLKTEGQIWCEGKKTLVYAMMAAEGKPMYWIKQNPVDPEDLNFHSLYSHFSKNSKFVTLQQLSILAKQHEPSNPNPRRNYLQIVEQMDPRFS